MVSALFDTNILADYLNGIEQARSELERYAEKAISQITWMEIMAGTTPETAGIVRGFLSDFDSLPIDEKVSAQAVALRKLHGIKLPDAIVWATAQMNRRLLVSRNTKAFSPDEPGIRVPYQI